MQADLIVTWSLLPSVSELKLPFDVTVYVYGGVDSNETQAALRMARLYGVLNELHQHGIVLIIKDDSFMFVVPGYDAIAEVVHRKFIHKEMVDVG